MLLPLAVVPALAVTSTQNFVLQTSTMALNPTQALDIAAITTSSPSIPAALAAQSASSIAASLFNTSGNASSTVRPTDAASIVAVAGAIASDIAAVYNETSNSTTPASTAKPTLTNATLSAGSGMPNETATAQNGKANGADKKHRGMGLMGACLIVGVTMVLFS